LVSRAFHAENQGQLENALKFYKDAISELEHSLKHKMEEKYYRSKLSEIRFNIDKLTRQINDSSGQIINFPREPTKP
jgi:septal ring factor EnvC (AmiA/AmiB activator)